MFLKRFTYYCSFSRSAANFSASRLSNMSKANENNMVWVDMEMTGLDIDTDHILEIACIVTDSQLNIIAEGPDIIIHQDDEILKNMNDWCIQQHGETGLTEASRNSTVDVKTAENKILEFIKPYSPIGRCPLAGNSVYMDRLFLQKHLPKLNSYLHYRIIDVSTVKELSKRWFPNSYRNVPRKTFQHRALSDIRESIEELKYYRQNVFKS